MQHCLKNRDGGWTLIELLVVIALLAILCAMIDWGPPSGQKKAAMRVICINNLKQIGMAYPLWGKGQSYDYPMQYSESGYGVKESAEREVACLAFQVLSNELSSPKILLCPADKNRVAATNFTSDFHNNRISYFAGLDATQAKPGSFLSGDDNFEIGGNPVNSGLLVFASNAPIAWTSARHDRSGNILHADGSVQTETTPILKKDLLQTGFATNRLVIP